MLVEAKTGRGEHKLVKDEIRAKNYKLGINCIRWGGTRNPIKSGAAKIT